MFAEGWRWDPPSLWFLGSVGSLHDWGRPQAGAEADPGPKQLCGISPAMAAHEAEPS